MKRAFYLVLFFLLPACAPTLKMEQHGGAIHLGSDESPRQVAILPFVNATEEPGIDTLVRRNFANHFNSKNFRDVKLQVVDEKLILFEKSSGKNWQQATPAELTAALGADGLLYGKVTGHNRIYAGVYSQLGVEAEVWLVNSGSGKELFRLQESVRYHEGGIPTSPLSAVVTVVSTAMNLRDIQRVRMVNELCYRFMEKIPSPPTLATEARPLIKEILTNAAEAPFGPKRFIQVGLEGEPGMVASFDIGDFRKGLPMKEVKPGIYSGHYPVVPGDNIRDLPITVTLSRPGGYETSWIDTSGFVTMDTTPPPPVDGLLAKRYADRIELSWHGIKNLSDLKGYRVLRSESPLSGYHELSLVEVPAFTDSTALAGKNYYYRVAALDRAGNEAEPGDGLRASLASGEPQKVGGELKADAVWEGPCLVTAPVIVPQGVTLTIAPESRILFAPETGLQVRGRLSVQGSDAPVEFAPAGQGKWAGIALDGARADLNRFTISGAVAGISSRESELALDGGVISGCDIGVAVSGMRQVAVKKMTISGNGTGLRLTGSAAEVTASSILQNQVGIVADGFSGEIRDNNFLDNGVNIQAEKPLAVAPNWFGTVQSDSLKLVNVTASRVYDGRLPGGQVVQAAVDPYLHLTPEERQKKGTELLIEAGSYFRQRNFGKAMTLFAENLKVAPSAETYYYLSLCHQEMNELDRAIELLNEGTIKYPSDTLLWRSLGMLQYQRGEEAASRKALEEALRLSPDDRQARFIMERLKKAQRQSQ